MKTKLWTLLSIFAFSLISFSGFSQTELPNYIFAENASPALVIISHLDFDQPYIESSFIDGEQVVDPNDFSHIDEAIWAEIVRVITNGFNELGIQPKAVVSVDMGEVLANPEAMTNYTDEMDIKPYYSIAMSFADNAKLKRKFKRNKELTANDLKVASIIIQPTIQSNVSNPYLIMKTNGKLSDLLSVLKADIDSKPESYFIDKIDDEEISQLGRIQKEAEEDYEKMTSLEKVGEEYNTYPDDITDKTLLVVHNYMLSGSEKHDKAIQKKIDWLEKIFDKRYNGDYKLVNRFEYASTLEKGDYKYVVVPFGEIVFKVKTTRNRAGADGGMVSENYYVVKDVNTNAVYYGPEKEKVQDKAAGDIKYSIRVFLNALSKHYGWN